MTVQHDDATGAARRAAGPPGTAEDLVLARLEGLADEHAVRPDPVFRAATRARLVAMAAVRQPSPRRRGLRRLLAARTPPRRGRLTAGLAGATLTVAALGGLLAAAQGAAPGDLLYEVKRGGEATQLVLAGDSSRGATLLDFASTRLGELTELAAAGDASPVLDTLRTMDRQTTEGASWFTTRAVADGDTAALQALATWTTGQRTGLDALPDDLPAGVDEALSGSRRLVSAVADRAAALGTALACAGGPAVTAADELGPRPTPCPTGAPAAQRPAPGTPSAPPVASGGAPAPGGAAPAAPSTSPVTTAAPAAGTATPSPAPAPTPSAAAPATPAAPAGPAPGERPGLPVPAAPASPSTAAPSRPGTVVELPPVVPGLRVCLPPLISVNCRPAAG
ncbi:DUF5667 domain-containing protein [Modestobacter sp. SYSU DS0657]